MKINGGISTGNILTIAALLVTIAVAYGAMENKLHSLGKDLDQKADKELIEVKLEYLQQDVNEIKMILKEKQWHEELVGFTEVKGITERLFEKQKTLDMLELPVEKLKK